MIVGERRADRWAGTFGSGLEAFQELSRFRVQEILLVSSLYDSFIMAEDGELAEAVLGEFLRLDPRHPPGLTRVTTGGEALGLAAQDGRYDLIITGTHVGDMTGRELARRVRAAGLTTPVIGLAYDARETEGGADPDPDGLDRVFLWQGDVRILLAIVKYVEDRLNVAADAGQRGVQVILAVEDSVPFYSSLLPAIYTEVMRHASRLVPEGVNLWHKLMRVQARPKILLCSTFEEAWSRFEAFQENVLGVISDIEFPRGGRLEPEAGLDFARAVRRLQPDVPVMLQSGRSDAEAGARAAGAAFLLKGSPTLLHDLQRFMIENFGFGDFIFRLPDGREVARAGDLKTLEETLSAVPADSVAYHGARNHFSKWLKARTEFALAHRLRPRKVSDFATVEGLRDELIRSIRECRHDRSRSTVEDFDPATFDAMDSFCRLGGGSLGGKGRGLAFVRFLLHEKGVEAEFPGVRIAVPAALVLGTNVFDDFLAANHLQDFAIRCGNDAELWQRFQRATFPPALRLALTAYLARCRYPIAVRSSSLLEDAQYQPFAGIYDTWMLPNAGADLEARVDRLLDAIKRVYASTFSARAKAYLASTVYRLEEEKMAVVIQRVAGAGHGNRFYPQMAGVARSHNFYPVPPLRAEDGIAAVALGLGATVVDGKPCVRFCPRAPLRPLQFTSVEDVLQNSQRTFHALRLPQEEIAGDDQSVAVHEFGLDVAERDGTLGPIGSTYSSENDIVYDGVGRPGVRLVSFAPLLKQELFPLAGIVDRLLAIGSAGAGTAVEIEFAATLPASKGAPAEFAFLQLRPLALGRELIEIDLGRVEPAALVCQSASVLGHGRMADICDAVVVDAQRFERARSQEVAAELARLNAALVARGVPYLLVGVGRWGSTEPLLGIPVTWDQIAGARVIVEAGLRDVTVSPSQGSHFFHNLAAGSVGYFTVNAGSEGSFVDWDWLAAQPAVGETRFVRHLRFDRPLVVQMNGRTQTGVILKPTP
jgi:CheY-like chemotaxis protein